MHSVNKHLVTLLDYSPESIRSIIDRAVTLKKNRFADDPQILAKRTGVLIFEKPSLRTRVSFETGITELGGHPINLAAQSIGMGVRESVEDIARNLERWVCLIVARTFAHETVENLARHSSAPVINALTDKFHPCQALAFGVTLAEHRPGKKHHVVFIGDGNNVCNSLMVLCAKLGFSFSMVCPPGFEPPDDVTEACTRFAGEQGAHVRVMHNAAEAVVDATVIYTDVWASMGQEAETEKRKKVFAAYQVNEELIAGAPDDVLVSHCLPAHRGEEITSGVLDSPRCIAFDEAENRLHAQKSIICSLFSE